jgi:hypothetical protein
VTLDTSPEAQDKVERAADENLAAGDWVADDPFLDENDPPVIPDDIDEVDGDDEDDL